MLVVAFGYKNEWFNKLIGGKLGKIQVKVVDDFSLYLGYLCSDVADLMVFYFLQRVKYDKFCLYMQVWCSDQLNLNWS